MFAILDLVLGLLVLLIVASIIARRAAFPEPLLLVPIGVAASYVPGVPAVSLDPDLVLDVFLPLLVYATAIELPWRQFRANLKPIGFLAFGLVLFTTVGVAVLAHGIVPGLSWAAAFALGAIISPPDVVAASSVIARMPIPRRISVILQGEGLVNDVTALTIFRFAVIAAVSGSFSLSHASFFLVASLVAGALYGGVVGWAALWIRNYLADPRLETTVSLITPFVAYLVPEHFGSSGVLAVAVAGLVVNARGSHMISAQTRLRATPVWEMIDFWLNGVLFLLLGLQLKGVLGEVPNERLANYLTVALAIGIATIVLRFVWVYVTLYTPLLWRSATEPAPRPRRSEVFLVSWTGMRGAISLAAALSIPLTLANGAVFPARDLIIFVTFAVILLTLIVQGSSLPMLIRALGLDREGEAEGQRGRALEYEARMRTLDAGMKRIEQLAKGGEVPPEWAARQRRELRDRKQTYVRHSAAGEDRAVRALARRELLALMKAGQAQRDELLRLRNEGRIDDEIMHRIERDLDEAELRLQSRVDLLPRKRGPQRAE